MHLVPYPHWLNAGDNAWQMTAATFVGLMSIPGLAVLYGGLVQKKWAVNTMLMTFAGFAIVLVAWSLWSYDMGFGSPLLIGHAGSFWGSFVGKPGAVTGHLQEQGQAYIPLLGSSLPPFRFPQASLVYFQFVFAAITPLLFLGSVLGRMNFKAWAAFVLLWNTLVYTVNAFLIWGGGYWAGRFALDYSGGYVIHLAAGVSGFVAAAVVGPRLPKDRNAAAPNNLLLVAVGAGILWLGWNGFNGGDPYFAGADASAAVINTNICTAFAMLTWVVWDMLSPRRKPSFVGAVNGMIVGLVCITPAAGFVNGNGAIFMGMIASSIVWFTMNVLGERGIFARVDDALGVVHTHGIAGLTGGLLVGVFTDPHMYEYLSQKGAFGTPHPVAGLPGLAYGGTWHQIKVQAGAALTIIVWDGIVTFIILKVIGFFIPLRFTDAELEIGDAAVMGEILSADELPEPVQPLPEMPLHGAHQPAGSGSGSSMGKGTSPMTDTGPGGLSGPGGPAPGTG